MYADMIVGLSLGAGQDTVAGLLPTTIDLAQNYPNPFNPGTVISFRTTKRTQATLLVYNLLGQKVRTLLDEPVDAGTVSVTWDGRDDGGREAAAGVYFYRLTAGEAQQSKKMMLLR